MLGHEGTAGRRRLELIFVWKKELTRLHSKYWALPLPLSRRKHKTYRMWKYWLDEENTELTVLTE